jgi:phosphoserine phosphatase
MADKLIDRLERARAELDGKMVIASDGDGTIWRGDIGDAVFLSAIDQGVLRSEALEALCAQASQHGIELDPTLQNDNPNAVALQLFEAHRQHRYPERDAFSMMSWAFAGLSPEAMRDFARQVLDAFAFDASVREEMRPVLSWARDNDVAFWLVSASPAAAVREAASRLGIAEERAVGMEPVVEDGVLQPRLASTPTYAEGKMERLRAATDGTLLAAFGDSKYDAAMMHDAKLAVGVYPNDALRAELSKMSHAFVIEGS